MGAGIVCAYFGGTVAYLNGEEPYLPAINAGQIGTLITGNLLT
jgi:hypothetical protein